MHAALLNKRIKIQKKVSERDDNGVSTSSWQPYFECWTTVSNESGATNSGEGMEKTTVDMTFTVRYNRTTLAIKPMSYRIQFEGDFFDIISVNHGSYRGRWIKFNCQQVRSSNVR